MQLSDKIKEIADGYALLTHKPQGWEGGASMEDYLRLREQALKEIGYTETVSATVPVATVPVAIPKEQPFVQESVSAEVTAKPVTKLVASAPKENKSAEIKPAEKKSDLDILKSLGE